METLQVDRLTPERAAQLLSGLEAFDPRGIATAADVGAMCRSGLCYALTHANGAQVVYVLKVRGGQVWVEAAKGGGPLDLIANLLETIEAQAKAAPQFDSVAFQTARPGLVRKAQRRGYRVAGWIMKKDLL